MRSARQQLQWFVVLGFIMMVAFSSVAHAETLHVWAWSNSAQHYETILGWYQEQNPGFTYELSVISGSQGEFTERLMLAIAGGSPPDLTWLEGSTVVELAAQDLLADVTRALEGIRFTPADTEEMTYQGKMWALPYFTTSRGLAKRVDIFNAAGLDPDVDPGSLEELWEWNQKLTEMDSSGEYRRVGIVPWTGNWGPPAWIWAFGGQLVDETGLRPTANHPNNILAFEWIQEWAQSYGGSSPVPVSIQQGTVAMAPVSTSDVGNLIGQGVDITTGRMPHAPGGTNGTWGGGQAIGIPKNAKNMDLAMEVLRFFGEAEVQTRRFETFPTVFPANWDSLQEVVRTLPRLYGALLEQLPEARPRTPLWIDYYVRNLNPQMNQVVAGRITPQAALENVQRAMEARFAEVFGE